ncbi:hypothetical protein T02_9131 [Trichinella nativa]|uniref:Uncharacterized protein n=1 Tax=Trichinella nativa TaxID=6335 RepID=A0A0V1KK34_9BILA|nr:hypothetical protein T02_9131 [Trichinella nativa]
MSAGFSLVRQYLQHWGVGYRLLYFLHSVCKERLPACRFSLNPRDGYSTVAPIAHSNAAISSSVGRLTCFNGANQAFAITRLTDLWWFIDSTLMYAQAAYTT